MKRQEEIKKALAAIRAKYGKLTPELVVKEARSQKSALNAEFDWNDKTAANLQRLDKARELLTIYVTVKVTERGGGRVLVPYAVRDPSAKSREQGYVFTMDRRSRAETDAIMQAEIDRIQSVISRGRAIAASQEPSHPGTIDDFEDALCKMILPKESTKRGGDKSDDVRPSP